MSIAPIPHDRRCRPAGRNVALTVVVACLLASAGHAGDLAIETSVVAAGGGAIASAGGCLAIHSSIGQDTLGVSQAGPFSVMAGFWPALATRSTDALFNDGFQECL